MNLGKSIKRLRLAKYPDLTQKEFGAMCGLSQGRLSKIENDKKELVDSQLTDIANALGVPVSHIVLKAEVAMKRNELL